MAARLNPQAQERLAARGVHLLETQQGFDALNTLLFQAAPQVGMFSVDWSQFIGQLPPGVSLPVLEQFQSAAPGESPSQPSQWLEQLKQVPMVERRDYLMARLREQMADILGFGSAHDIDPAQPLADMGVDSLMAVELANQLEQNLGPAIPSSFLFEHPTLEELVRYLIAHMPTVEFSTMAEDRPMGGEASMLWNESSVTANKTSMEYSESIADDKRGKDA